MLSTPIPIPHELLASPLVHEWNGFVIYDALHDHATLGQLFDEAAASYPEASEQECWDCDADEIRGGTPRRKLLSAGAGPVQDAVYADDHLHEALSSHCGITIVPSGNRGSYSYYARPGDFLDLHRDIETCDLALITALHDNSDPADQGGALAVYPGRIHEPLSSIRASPHDGAYAIKLQPGQSILILGGVVPHRVLPVVDGQVRIVSVLCFQALL